MTYKDKNYREWKAISHTAITPEDYGYIALYVAIIKNISCTKALIRVKGKVNQSDTFKT